MHVTRVRFWILAILVFLYIAGVLFLSAVTLHEPRTLSTSSSSSLSSLTYNNNNNIKLVANRHTIQKYQQQFWTASTQTKTAFKYNGGGGGRIVAAAAVTGVRLPLRRSRIQWCTPLTYLYPPRRSVALVSFPGSGNTWLRYLLQQATGIHTGSVYKDYGLLKNGFPAENVMNGSVLVVKTHEWGAHAHRNFARAILLVRKPRAAIQAEFNRQSGGHIGFATPDRYKRTKGRYWQQFVHDKLDAWQRTNLNWLYNFTGPTHIIFYEQLVDNVADTLRSVIEFLDVMRRRDDDDDDAAGAADRGGRLFRCAVERKEGIYRRKRRALNFDPYTARMKEQIGAVERRVYEAIYNVAALENGNNKNKSQHNPHYQEKKTKR